MCLVGSTLKRNSEKYTQKINTIILGKKSMIIIVILKNLIEKLKKKFNSPLDIYVYLNY